MTPRKPQARLSGSDWRFTPNMLEGWLRSRSTAEAHGVRRDPEGYWTHLSHRPPRSLQISPTVGRHLDTDFSGRMKTS